MAIWIAILAMAAIILVLAIFYLINSLHRYGKWGAPVCLIVISLIIGIISGINIYNINRSEKISQTTSQKVSKNSSVVTNGLQKANSGITQNEKEQRVLTDLQNNFKNIGTVSFDENSKTYVIKPTDSKNIEAINYVLQNPQKAGESGYDKLTSGILNTDIQLKKSLGDGYTLELLKPNSSQSIYAAKDGKEITNVINNK